MHIERSFDERENWIHWINEAQDALFISTLMIGHLKTWDHGMQQELKKVEGTWELHEV